MSLYTGQPIAEPLLTATQGDRYKTSKMQLLKLGISEGWQYSTFGALGKTAQWYAAGTRQYSDSGFAEDNDLPLSKEEWQESDWYRDGLEYQEGLTAMRAQILAQRKDAVDRNNFLRSHADAGVTGAALGLVGNMVGAAFDPINYIPVFGYGAKAFLATKVGVGAIRAGKGAKAAIEAAKTAARITGTQAEVAVAGKVGAVGARAIRGATEAGVGTTIQQPLIMHAEREGQEDYDVYMAMANIAIATGFGTTFGAAAGMLGRVRPETRTEAFSKAIDDIAADRPVDVAPVIKPALEKIRQKQQTELDNLIAVRKEAEHQYRVRQATRERTQFELVKAKSEKAKLEAQPKAAEPIASEEFIAKTVRNEIERGYAGRRVPVKDEFGVIVSYEGIPSGYPDYFKDKGLRRKEVLNIIDKKLAGKKLTEKQQGVYDDLIAAKTGELENEKYLTQKEATSEERPNTIVADLGLKPGDEFTVYGESYKVKSINADGNPVVDIEGTEHTLDMFGEIPQPDEGSMARRSSPELAALNDRIAALEKELSEPDPVLDTGAEPFVPPEIPDDIELEADLKTLQADLDILKRGEKIDAGDIALLEAADNNTKHTSNVIKVFAAAKNCILRGGG